jgi:formylglycine-generating enzyme required for sulfatase activity
LKKKDNHIIKAIVEWDQNANGYRLPTEAEWLYCAKASQDYIYSGSNEIAEVACYDQSHLNCTKQYEMSPVKNYKANGWGLYDMSGNVWEWCMDKWDGDSIKNRENPILWDSKPCSHVMRGGSYLSTADQCQLKFRSKNIVDQASDRGFRLFRSIHF